MASVLCHARVGKWLFIVPVSNFGLPGNISTLEEDMNVSRYSGGRTFEVLF